MIVTGRARLSGFAAKKGVDTLRGVSSNYEKSHFFPEKIREIGEISQMAFRHLSIVPLGSLLHSDIGYYQTAGLCLSLCYPSRKNCNYIGFEPRGLYRWK